MGTEKTAAIYMILCYNGKKCWLPGSYGSTWEESPKPPYLNEAEAKQVVKELDHPKYEKQDGTTIDLDPAPCGPHQLQRFVPEK